MKKLLINATILMLGYIPNAQALTQFLCKFPDQQYLFTIEEQFDLIGDTAYGGKVYRGKYTNVNTEFSAELTAIRRLSTLVFIEENMSDNHFLVTIFTNESEGKENAIYSFFAPPDYPYEIEQIRGSCRSI